MKFFTSYYANISNIPVDYVLVSVSGDIPEQLEQKMDIHDKRLSPSVDFFKEYKSSSKGKAREKIFVQKFKDEVLADISITDILKEWSDECGLRKTYVLLCYEKPEDFCHRHIVSEYLSEYFDIFVEEYGVDYKAYELKDYKIQLKETLDEDEW